MATTSIPAGALTPLPDTYSFHTKIVSVTRIVIWHRSVNVIVDIGNHFSDLAAFPFKPLSLCIFHIIGDVVTSCSLEWAIIGSPCELIGVMSKAKHYVISPLCLVHVESNQFIAKFCRKPPFDWKSGIPVAVYELSGSLGGRKCVYVMLTMWCFTGGFQRSVSRIFNISFRCKHLRPSSAERSACRDISILWDIECHMEFTL